MIYISIVIPIYNLSRYIETTLRSIVNSKDISTDEYEIVLVDDGSRDNSLLVANKFVIDEKFSNVRIFHQHNGGVSSARNYGMEMASGKYVWFVDGDDSITSNALFYIVSIMKQFQNFDVLKIGKCIRDTEETKGLELICNKKVSPQIEDTKEIEPYFLADVKLNFGHTTYIWNRDFLKTNRLRYPENLTHNEDLLFLFKALSYANSALINMSYEFYLVRNRKDSASRDIWSFIKYNNLQSSYLAALKNANDFYNNNSERWSDQKKQYFFEILNGMALNNIVLLLGSRQPLYYVKYYLRVIKSLNLYPLKNTSMYPWIYSFCLNHTYLYYILCICCRCQLFRNILKVK